MYKERALSLHRLSLYRLSSYRLSLYRLSFCECCGLHFTLSYQGVHKIGLFISSGSIKLQVSFAKETYKRDEILLFLIRVYTRLGSFFHLFIFVAWLTVQTLFSGCTQCRSHSSIRLSLYMWCAWHFTLFYQRVCNIGLFLCIGSLYICGVTHTSHSLIRVYKQRALSSYRLSLYRLSFCECCGLHFTLSYQGTYNAELRRRAPSFIGICLFVWFTLDTRWYQGI